MTGQATGQTASQPAEQAVGLTVGGPAPDFTLRDQFGQDVTLSSFVGHKAVLLVFYPYAFSNVCTGEMSQIRSRLDEFMTFDSEVLAISCDPTAALRAFVVLKPGQSIDEAGVQDFVKDNLARYKSPRDVVFLDELPRNPTGKVLKRELS